MDRKGSAAAIIGVVIALVVVAVGLVIVDQVVSQQTFNNTLSETIKVYIVPIGLVGSLGVAGAMAIAGRRR